MFSSPKLLPTIPAKERGRVATFLEKQNYKELALDVATDPDHRFALAISLNV